ncbi:MAG TPA: CBS domain-containing protein, partial [Rhodospirillales bacterium]|nr:CBS domain-containing protein [Rhodospirillales bacterium]
MPFIPRDWPSGGELLTHHKDKAVLSQLRLETLIEKDATTIKEDATLGDLVKVIANSKRNIIAVLDENQMLLGIVPLDSIRKIMFNQEMYDVTEVGSLMVLPPTYVYSTEPMEEVLKKFEDSGEWSLP